MNYIHTKLKTRQIIHQLNRIRYWKEKFNGTLRLHEWFPIRGGHSPRGEFIYC